VRDLAKEYLGLASDHVKQLLGEVSGSVQEAAEVFDVRIAGPAERDRILAQARETLLDMALETQLKAARLQDLNERLRHDAWTDPLTGLANRACFEDVFCTWFEQACGNGKSLGVLFLDADHFKQVNDTFGHSAGDEVLRRLGRIVSRSCPQNALSARYGGEEIVCVLQDVGLATAVAKAEEIRNAVENEIIEVDGKLIPLTVSLGAVAMDRGAGFEQPEQLLAAADRALYEAKRTGRNRVGTATSAHVRGG